ncbi:hypothetical protein CPB86DRAFT_383436 [Serendipita vermifera]|nr:hypothetical protein CPB86DRAFT_383436 [Serendipita vermifera]
MKRVVAHPTGDSLPSLSHENQRTSSSSFLLTPYRKKIIYSIHNPQAFPHRYLITVDSPGLKLYLYLSPLPVLSSSLLGCLLWLLSGIARLQRVRIAGSPSTYSFPFFFGAKRKYNIYIESYVVRWAMYLLVALCLLPTATTITTANIPPCFHIHWSYQGSVVSPPLRDSCVYPKLILS